MQAVRPDYVKMLKIIAVGNVKALTDYVQKNGSWGLPAAIGAVAAGSRPNQQGS